MTERAIELHTRCVGDSLRAHTGIDSRYSSYGMDFVRFAAEEKQLFRWLYLEGKQIGAYQNDVLQPTGIPRWVEGVEQVTRIAYLRAITHLMGRQPLHLRGV